MPADALPLWRSSSRTPPRVHAVRTGSQPMRADADATAALRRNFKGPDIFVSSGGDRGRGGESANRGAGGLPRRSAGGGTSALGSLAQHASGSLLAAPFHDEVMYNMARCWNISCYPLGEALPNVAALPGGVQPMLPKATSGSVASAGA